MFVEFNWLGALTGSPILMSLVLGSVVTGAIALERLVYFRRVSGDADSLLADTLTDLRASRVDAALARCRAARTPLARVATETLECFLSRPEDTEETMQVALSNQKLLMERNTGVLGTMASIAPLVGLLGTVWGIMRAFHDMSTTGSAAPSVVASGVAEALVTTAAGLVIAVPAVLLFNHFNRRMNVTLTVAENHTRTMRTVLAEVCDSGRNNTGTGDAAPAASHSARTARRDEPSLAVAGTRS